MKRMINEILFWLHFLLLPVWIVFSVVASPYVVIALALLHQLHLKIFHGCSLTHLQRKLGGVNVDRRFFEYAWDRMFGHPLSRRAERTLGALTWIVPLAVVFVRVVT